MANKGLKWPFFQTHFGRLRATNDSISGTKWGKIALYYAHRYAKARREGNCSAGGGGDTEAHFPNQPPPSLAAVTGRGVQGGGARPAVPGGGGSTQHL